MKANSLYDELKVDYSPVEEAGFNPYYPKLQSGLDDPVYIGGRPYINLASNNYLGFANDPSVKEACIQGIKDYGVSLCATPIASGYPELYYQVQEKLARFLNLEQLLLYPSCYQANNGLFSAIASKDDLVIIDRCVHSSMIEGIRPVQCKIRPFMHNDPSHLETVLLKSQPYRRVFVVTESVFSTEGEIAPLGEIYKLCQKHGATCIVDDSHGIGVLGDRGAGILDHEHITDFKGIYTASLGKALAVNGGIIGGDRRLIEYLSYFSSHLVYSTAVSPGLIGALGRVIDLMREEFHIRGIKMWEYKRRLAHQLQLEGFDMVEGKAPINSIKGGNPANTLKIANLLYREGILSTPFIHPSVSYEGGRIRLIAGANLKEESIDKACRIFGKIKTSMA